MIPTFCVAHKLPLVPGALYDAVINPASQPGYETLVQVAAYPPLIRLAERPGLIGICGLRKFILRGGSGNECITPQETQKLSRADMAPAAGLDFLVSAYPLNGATILEQYLTCHPAVEWEDFMALAVEMRVIDNRQRREVEESTVLFGGGPPLGVFPARFVQDLASRMSPLYAEFARRHGERIRTYDPIQRRVMAFLAERLESHFISKELERRHLGGVPPQVFGRLMFVLAENEMYVPGMVGG
jgi:hypothetical protein